MNYEIRKYRFAKDDSNKLCEVAAALARIVMQDHRDRKSKEHLKANEAFDLINLLTENLPCNCMMAGCEECSPIKGE
jgi:hypothetical protein